jgi:hypothetical protein
MTDPKYSRDLLNSTPMKDLERDSQEAVVEDADRTDIAGRDLVHGDGGTLGLDTADDLRRDD